MRKINKQLIVSDFDGTLITSDQTVPDKVRSAISEYVQCGGIFAVCTGRMLRSILPRVRELGLKGLVIAYQGTVIAEIESGKILKKNFMQCEDVVRLCRFTDELGYLCNAYADEILYTTLPRDSEALAIYERVTGIDAVCVDIPMHEYVKKNGLKCHKVTYLVAPENREKLYRTLLDKFDADFDVTCSADVLVEVSPKDDNKGAAIKFIAKYYGIDMSSTVAIGDNLNDLSMIKTASVGVAVGNAVEELKKQADDVTVSNNEGAVAEIIEKYGLI